MDAPSAIDEDALVGAALRSERRFVLALGGFALEIPGGTLVTHEKIPSPRFNFVAVGAVAPDRQAAFFERALDHYFQRALRPRFRVPAPAPDHVDRGLRRFSFEPTGAPLVLLVDDGHPTGPPDPAYEVRPADDDVDLVASFWTEPSERPELRAAIDVAVHHPTPGESLRPYVARARGAPVSAALVFRAGTAAGIHLVTTRAEARGRGAATALVDGARAALRPEGPARASIVTEVPRIAEHLATIGLSPRATFVEYALPPAAELDLPPPGPAGPARWRPPR